MSAVKKKPTAIRPLNKSRINGFDTLEFIELVFILITPQLDSITAVDTTAAATPLLDGVDLMTFANRCFAAMRSM
jgi:hypothetical protein